MITLKFDSAKFQRDMKNLVDYSVGFVEGIELGKKEFFNRLGPVIAEQASEFIDMNARVDYASLHHVYEWYNAGNSNSRLFNINYTVSNLGLSFLADFSQSRTVAKGSKEPFFDKARIMESGQSVRIAPKNSEVLRFEVGGQEVFTKKPIIVDNPGGDTAGQFANVFDMFFGKYFSQAFLRSTGLAQYFQNPSVYKKNLAAGKKGGRITGKEFGSRWVANAGRIV